MFLATFKIMIYVLVVSSFIFIADTVVSGIAIRKSVSRYRQDHLGNHMHSVKFIGFATLVTIALVLMFKMFLPELAHHPPIFTTHLRIFAVPFVLVGLLTAFFRNGNQTKKYHRYFGYSVVVLGIGTNILGAYMAHLLPW